MSFISDIFSGSKGAGFQAASTPIVGGFSQEGANESYSNAVNGVRQQQGLVDALNGQNGLANQSSVYNQLQGVANGTGPNPAQAMLNQATGANVANQAALMASQRGTSANPGMIARQAAQQGANIQQNAVGQGATMQANQSLGALGQLGGLANQQVANQIGGVQGLNAAAQGQEGIYNQGIAAQNNANVAMQSNQNNANAQIANTNAGTQGGILKGVTSGIGGAIGLAKGGAVPHYADGTPNGVIPPPTAAPAAPQIGGPTSKLGKALSGFAAGPNASENEQNGQALGQAIDQGIGAAAKGIGSLFSSSGGAGASVPGGGGPEMLMAAKAKGGEVKAYVSPGEKYLSPKEVKEVSMGKKRAIDAGETIPGKPKVGGAKDSYANDTVRKTLEAGGVVLPRHVTQAKNPAKEAEKFVAAIMARQGIKGKH